MTRVKLPMDARKISFHYLVKVSPCARLPVVWVLGDSTPAAFSWRVSSVQNMSILKGETCSWNQILGTWKVGSELITAVGGNEDMGIPRGQMWGFFIPCLFMTFSSWINSDIPFIHSSCAPTLFGIPMSLSLSSMTMISALHRLSTLEYLVSDVRFTLCRGETHGEKTTKLICLVMEKHVKLGITVMTS